MVETKSYLRCGDVYGFVSDLRLA